MRSNWVPPIKLFLRRLLTYSLGALVFALRPQRHPRVLVLAYHSIDETGWKYGVTREAFRSQMEYIRRNCNPVTLDAVHQFMDQEILLPDRSIAVTFDDGYQSVYQEAFPILREFRIPATVFVVTNLKVGSAETTHSFPVLTWGQMQAMQNSGLVTFGAHGHTHRSLDLLSGEEAKNEIENSMALVVGHLGVSPKFFSYPRGRFSDAVKRIVKDVGFLGSVSTKQGLVSPGDDVYQIKRVEINRDISFSEFRVRLTQAIDWLTFFWRKYHGFG